MPGPISQRLLPVLQLTRIALVFTAVSNSVAAMLLLAKWSPTVRGGSPWDVLTPWNIAAIVVMSIGMYGFGMSLNDIIDRRRDSQIAPGRPLPSGRIAVRTAHFICAAMAAVAILGAAAYAWGTMNWPASIVVAGLTLALIFFYDFAGKYLVAAGLVSLGLIRFFHAVIAAPSVPLLWHPLILLNHVTLLSAVCYGLEDKRPRLTRGHWGAVIVGLVVIHLVCVAAVWYRRGPAHGGDAMRALWITPGLWLSAAAAATFIASALIVWRNSRDARSAGQSMMLVGLLWVIVYDAAIVAGYVDYRAAMLQLLLLPIAYLSVQLMRWWSRLIALSQPVEYQRAR